METSFEQLDGLSRKLTIEIPAEVVAAAAEQQMRKERPRLKVAGFRAGKVPPHILKQKFGGEMRREALNQLINDSYQKALAEGKYDAVSYPEIDLLSGFKDGEALKFTATFEVMPEVTVRGLDNLNITLVQTDLQDSDVEQMLNTLQRQQAVFIDANDKVTDTNDRVKIDFVGRIDGEAFEGGSGNDVLVTIGAGQMLPDFEAGLKGFKLNEEKTFDVGFPENYHAPNLAGKTAQFTATVKGIETMKLPELTPEFIKRFGMPAGSLDEFKQAVKDNMSRELGNATRRIKRERLFDALVNANQEQEIANAQIQQEVSRMASRMNLEKQIPDAQQRLEIAQQVFAVPARRQVLLGLLLGKLFEEKNIQLDEGKLEARLNEIASTYENPEEVKSWYAKDANARNSLASAILEEQLIDALYEQAKVTYESKTFQELMAISNQLPR